MKTILSIFTLLCTCFSYSQVGIGTTNPDSSSILELASTTQGLLTPRMTEVERNAIPSPATGLLIYQIDSTKGFYYYDGSSWTPFGGSTLGVSDSDWTIVGDDMYNNNSGNLGVGNTTPSTKFHVTGTTVPGSSGGLTTLYSNDFSSGSLNNNLNVGNTCTSIPNVWHIASSSSYASCNTCSGDRAYIEYDSCIQNQTLTEGTFIPTKTTINISFNYGFNDYLNQSLFRVILYNETTGLTLDTLLDLTIDALNTNYTGSHTVVSGNTYSLKFLYIGINVYGAAVDDILITETGSLTGGAYVFRLEDGQEQDGYVLTSDADGNATWKSVGAASAQTLSISGNDLTISSGNTVTLPSGGGGGSYSFTNGLTESSGTARLGGSLTNSTYITMGSYDLYFEGTGTGDIIFEDNTGQPQMTTNFSEGYTNFGDGGAYIDSDDGSTFLDTYGGGPFTKDFVLGAYNGSSGGTSIALGSIEYIVDGTNELFYEGGAFSPMDDFSSDLGVNPFTGNTRRWDDVNADDFITPTNTYSRTSGLVSEDTNLKKGLDVVMKLKPITYKDNMQYVNGKKIPNELREDKLGFYIDELLQVLPEAVKTSDWVSLDESGKKTRVVYDRPNGIKFSQIIPVTVKAIQEQQKEIEVLKTEVSDLKKMIARLIQDK